MEKRVSALISVYFILLVSKVTITEKTKLRVGALLSIFNDARNATASNINIDSVKHLEAIFWVFKHLNRINYIDGYELELVPAYTGNSPDVANLKVKELISTDCEESDPVIAVLGPETVDEVMSTSYLLSSVPENYRVPQVIFSTSSNILSDRTKYRNLLRVIQSDDSQIKAIMKVLEKIEWNMIAIVYENNQNGQNTAKLFKTEAAHNDICVAAEFIITALSKTNYTEMFHHFNKNKINGIVFFGSNVNTQKFLEAADLFYSNRNLNIPAMLFSDISVTSDAVFEKDGVLMTSSKGAIFMRPSVNHISSFQDHWFNIFQNLSKEMNVSTSNPYIKILYESLPQCTNLGCKFEHFINMTTLYSPYAIHAAFVLAKALKLAISKTNGKIEFTDIRNELFNLEINYSEFINLGIDVKEWSTKIVKFENGVPNSNEYFVQNYQRCDRLGDDFCSKEIGHYLSNKEDLVWSFENFRDYVNGEEVNWNNRRTGTCPVGSSCETCLPSDLPHQVLYIPGDFVILAAMPIYNIGANPFHCDGIREKVGLDLALAMQWIIQEINNKGQYFPGKKVGMVLFNTCNDPLLIQEKVIGFYKNGMRIGEDNLTNKVLGFTGSVGSGPTIAIADVVNKLNTVHVGCCSVSATLGDKSLYPTFLRVSMSMYKAVELMIEIAQLLGVNTIQVLYSEGKFGENGRDLTLKMTRDHRIWVAKNISVPEKTDDDYQDVLQQLQSDVPLVFVFLRSHVAPVIASAYNKSRVFSKNQHTFLTSDAWGNRHDNIRNNPKLEGTISIAQEMKMKWDDIKDFFINLHPRPREKQNAFLLPYFESVFNCYFSWSYNKTYPEACTMDHLFSKDTKLDAWTPYVVWAVHALIKGASSAYASLCGAKGDELCDVYRSNPRKVRDIIQKVRLDVDFDDVEDQLFDDNGDGVGGFGIYMATQSADSNLLEYKEIGEKRFGQDITIDISEVQKMNPQIMQYQLTDSELCSRLEIVCAKDDSSDQVKIALYTVTTLLTVIALINIIILIRCIYKKIGKHKKSPHKVYLDACHENSVSGSANNYMH